MTVLGGWPLENMSGLTTQLIGPSTDDDNSILALIGFTFRFDNVNYTTFGVNGNGLITLGNVTSGALDVNDIRFVSPPSPKIMPYWNNVCVGSNGNVHYKTIGGPGMRKLVIEWQNMQITRNGACSGPGGGTFQLWLLENIGVIQFVYGNGMIASAPVDGGYTVGVQSGGTGNFAAVTTASNTVSYSAPNDTQTGAIPVGTSYVFVPNVPPPPSGANVTALSQTSLQLNWTDNAATETGYIVSRSTDNVNFTIVGSLAFNAVSFADSNLDPATQYFYRINAVSEGAFGQEIAISATTLTAGNISSVGAGGLWSSQNTWAGGVVPGPGDNVTIADGSTVTIDINASVLSLTVSDSASLSEADDAQLGSGPATLTFEETAPHSLTVERNVLIKSNGIFATSGLGNVTGHVLTAGRDLTNNGTLDFSTNNNAAGAGIVFTGILDNVFNGAGPVTDVRTITLNKGTSSVPNTLELAPANFTVQGSATDTPGSGFLTLNNGTFKISGTFSGAHRTFPAAAYFIGSSSGIWLNNPNYTVAGQAGSATIAGLFRVTSGTYNVGISAGNSVIIPPFSFNTVIIEGGAVNVAGRFGASTTATNVIWQYAQSGGTLTVCAKPGNSSQFGCFDTGIAQGNTMSMTGGNIVLQNPNTFGSGPRDYRNFAGTTATVTGGTVRFGNASTAAAGTFNGTGIFPNLVIDNTVGGNTLILRDGFTFPNLARDVTINPGTTFEIPQAPFYMNGSNFVNNGTLNAFFASSNLVWFDPTGNQTYSGTGVSAGIMTRFTVQSQSVTLAGSNNIRVRNLNVFTGNIINANKLTLGNNDPFFSIVQFGDTFTPTPAPAPAGTLDTAPVFDLGTGGQAIRYLRSGGIRTTGPEVNPSRVLVSLTFDNDDPATDELNIAGGDLTVAGALELTNGEIKTGANKLTHNGTVTRVNGFVNGTLDRTYTATGNYTYHVGVNGYSPVFFLLGILHINPSSLSVKPVDTTLPGLIPVISASRYWEVRKTGNLAGRIEFTYTDADINGDESTYFSWISRGGAAPVHEGSTNNPATNTVISSQPITLLEGDWGPGHFAQPRSIGGTVRTAGGAPIRNATVILSGGGLPAPRVAQTGSLGSYIFDNVLTGTHYNLFISAKRFRFSPISRDIFIYGDDFTQDFTANPQEGGLLFGKEKD